MCTLLFNDYCSMTTIQLLHQIVVTQLKSELYPVYLYNGEN